MAEKVRNIGKDFKVAKKVRHWDQDFKVCFLPQLAQPSLLGPSRVDLRLCMSAKSWERNQLSANIQTSQAGVAKVRG